VIKPLYIFDLDGTLALIQHRRHFVERPSLKCYDCGGKNWRNCVQCSDLDAGFKPNWPAFFKACVDDQPNKSVIGLLQQLRGIADVEVWSGRSDEVREETEQWLLKYANYTGVLKMRKKGDYTVDHKLKLSWLEELSEGDRKRLAATFDDRDQVVQMWRQQGILCCQVAPGDF